MAYTSDYLKEVGEISQALEKLGFTPILVGGMALVILGSRRVTRDFDFVIAKAEETLKELIDVFYDRGFELAIRLNKQGEIVATLDNRKVAEIRLRLDFPISVYFLNPKSGLRIDLLFDFPIPAKELAAKSKKIKVSSHVIHIASKTHLLRLKNIAKANRSKPGDVEDIAFLKSKPYLDTEGKFPLKWTKSSLKKYRN